MQEVNISVKSCRANQEGKRKGLSIPQRWGGRRGWRHASGRRGGRGTGPAPAIAHRWGKPAIRAFLNDPLGMEGGGCPASGGQQGCRVEKGCWLASSQGGVPLVVKNMPCYNTTVVDKASLVSIRLIKRRVYNLVFLKHIVWNPMWNSMKSNYWTLANGKNKINWKYLIQAMQMLIYEN